MSHNAIFLTYRVDCIAGKPPPTVRYLLRGRAAPKRLRGTQSVVQRFTSRCSLARFSGFFGR
ncbi:hypothetical protein, partial [Pseudomonas viridiflava]|uniref:hypothetical protein n=1 Tax=Pseudomonas viridiflava TaxID=33069 RepID=UPI00197FE532